MGHKFPFSMLCCYRFFSQVLGLIRRNFRARYDIRLTLEDYVRLLGVELVCGGDPKQLTHAFSYIRTIKNVSYNNSALLV